MVLVPDTTPSRPREVVTAAVMTIAGSALALAAIFTSVGEIRSSGVRREVESALDDARFSGLDVTPEQILNILHMVILALAACCVIAIVLAVYVLRGHAASRIALTVLGAPLALLSLLAGWTGLVIALFIAYSVSMLWRPASRAWFKEAAMSGDTPSDGAPQEPRPPDAGEGGQPGDADRETGQQAAGEEGAQRAPRPGPYFGYGQQGPPGQSSPPGPPPAVPPPAGPPQSGQPQQGPPQYGQPQQGQPQYDQPQYGEPQYGQPPPGYGPPPDYGQGYGAPQGYYGAGGPFAPDPNRRPGAVVGALVMTWIGVAFMVLIGLVCLAFAGSQELVEAFSTELRDQGITVAELTLLLRVVGGVLLVWGLIVGTVSVFAWRRANWARIALIVMAALYGVLQLLALLAGELSVVVTIAYVAVIMVLLLLPPVRGWYASRSMPPGYGGPPAPPPQTHRPW
jgi:hypothetical protein